MFKRLKRLLKRKKHAPIYPAGGYPTPTDLYSRARSGEMVINSSQKDALLEVLYDIEDSEITINEDELAGRICECVKTFNSVKVTNCPNCGAPLHGHKCDYCGTEP